MTTQTLGLGRLASLPLFGIGTPILLLVMLGLMILPLPGFALDIFFTFNIALALLVLLASVYTLRPLEFAVFPTVLLIATLLRLALNVASTRVVLLRGHEGTDAAGEVIEAFGDFVIGGNYAVGLVVFIILVIINFVVVTKGAGRVSEVTARFTLDAMPGKQMAIDADLNAGSLTQEQARKRREEVGREADFYGAMDGASKFVRGDAIAGILILLINVIGGFTIGIVYHDLSANQAAENYVLLTIGDGLVAQVPSLLLSAATAILVTRVSDSQDIGQQIFGQLFNSPRGLTVAGGVLLILGVIPGMPNLVFLALAAVMFGGAWYLSGRAPDQQLADEEAASEIKPEQDVELSWQDVPSVDIIGLQVGYRLISMVDQQQDGELLGRIKGVRKKLSQEIGFLIQPVHIKDNLDLDPNAYRILFQDVPVGEGKVYPGKFLAINPGQALGELNGIKTIDPAFGLDAIWIEGQDRDNAQALGYTVVDASTVIATQFSELLKAHANELLGHDEVQHLLDMLAESAPRLVENLVPKTLSLGVVLKVMQNLLEEKIPIRDVRSIAEALAEHAPKSQDPDTLTAQVRVSLSRIIYQNINGMEPELSIIALEPKLEQILLQTMAGTGSEALEPQLVEKMMRQLSDAVSQVEATGKPAVLLVSGRIRLWLSRLIRASHSSVHVLAYEEMPGMKKVNVATTIGG
ncbi:MAG: flagellar biosynthesis protein FlhA [Pseudomonadota bacterium]